jgi:hypothetical protein
MPIMPRVSIHEGGVILVAKKVKKGKKPVDKF